MCAERRAGSRVVMGRRAALSMSLALPLVAHARAGQARPRLPLGGRVALRVPFAVDAIDPHRLDDPLAAIFGDAIFDTLYVKEGAGYVPSLAESEPKLEAEGLVVPLRRGLVTAEGRPLDARDVVFALGRARRFGARAWLGDLGTVERQGEGALRFSLKDAPRLMALLASPLAAVAPIAFEPGKPDGTGPFQAQRRSDAIAFARNARAARGPALLDEIVVKSASDLAASLRSFEAGTDDIGWLGAGLYAPRRGAKNFDAGMAAWVVLRVGKDAAAWDAPGTVQRILDGVVPSKLAQFGLGPAWPKDREEGWGGPPGDVIVRDDAPYLVEIARTLAALLSRPGHELTAKPIGARELSTRRGKRDYLLALDLVRPLGAGALAAQASLAACDDAGGEAGARVSRVADTAPPRTLTRTMRIGIVGEMHVQGARIPELLLPIGESGWDLGSASRAKRSA